jgi:hypothetical protein
MDTPESVAERLVKGLEDLRAGEGIVSALIHLGTPAIAPLRRFLLHGRPSTVYHARRWAVRALGGLGAGDVLMEYLSQAPSITDAEIKLAEEAVENAAVAELVSHPSEMVVRFLLELSRRRMLPSLVSAFGELRLVEALPFLDRALEDDVCRPAAEEALRKIGAAARSHLLLSATTPLPAAACETPSSLRRRRSALWILAETGVGLEEWRILRALVADQDPEILTALGIAGLAISPAEDRQDLIRRLVPLSAEAPWYLIEHIRRCLLAWFDLAEEILEAEIQRRTATARARQGFDEPTRFFLQVLHAGKGSSHSSRRLKGHA